MNGPCPNQIGGARIIAYAIIGKEHTHLQGTTQIVNGQVMGAATAMIIAQYDGEDSYYVFGVYGKDWISSTDTWHENLNDAIEQLDWEYSGLSKKAVWPNGRTDLTSHYTGECHE